MRFRDMVTVMLAVSTVGCGQYGVSGPNDLGLVEQLKPRLHVDLIPSPSTQLTDGVRRNQELSKWIVISDDKCNKYLLQLSRGIRDSRLTTDVVGTVLSGLATILAPVGTKTALSGAATITLGVGGDFQSDLFAQQAGEVLISAVQTVRTRARKDLQEKMRAPYESYTLEQGLVDIQRYDQETCNLNVGLNELRASLISGPKGERYNNPILEALPIQLPVPPPPPPPPPAAAPAPPADLPHTGPVGGPRTRTIRQSGKGNVVIRETPQPGDQIQGAIGEEMKLNKEQGRAVEAGLCLVPDKDPVVFGKSIRDAIVSFRQTVAANTLVGARRDGGLSLPEANYLETHKCDTQCARNAYEYHEFEANTQTKQAILKNLAAKLKAAKPGLDAPAQPGDLCALRPAIIQVQTTEEKFSKWKGSNGTLDTDFVNALPPPFRPND